MKSKDICLSTFVFIPHNWAKKFQMSDGIRNQYSDLGVEGFYCKEGANYSNPHFSQVEELLQKNEHRIDYSQVLDFCCGSGEVSFVLEQMGYLKTIASDPFTQEAYKQRMGKKCQSWTFEDIVKGKLVGTYSAVVCSFAMHLCADDLLFPLSYQLFQHTPHLIIITPHKRPELEKLEGIHLDFEDFCLTDRGKKVRLRAFRSTF